MFQPAKLAQWWEKRGRLWVDQFADINPQLLRRGSAVEPALLQAIAEEFDELDATGSGRLNAQELLELFQRLGLPRTIKVTQAQTLCCARGSGGMGMRA